jgi:hypothetical protein
MRKRRSRKGESSSSTSGVSLYTEDEALVKKKEPKERAKEKRKRE